VAITHQKQPQHLSTQAVAESAPLVMEGIPLTMFEQFIDDCGGRSQLEGLTTTDVCNKFVKEMTGLSQCSYCKFLTLNGSSKVTHAQVFVSHAWSYKFLEVYEALRFHLISQPDTVVWFDLFSNNQHKASSELP
jgi:hypothetical protein